MGYPMAGHLKNKGGHDVTVYNRTTAQGREMGRPSIGGAFAKTPAEAAEGKDFVFSCVGNDDDLRAVTIGPDGAFKAMKKGAVFIDNTTASAEVARELAEKAAGARLRLPRRAGLGRPGRRGERHAHRHGRRRAGRFRQGQAGHRRLCPHGRPDGAGGRRPAHQDDQPDLHRRPGAGAGRRHPFRQEGRARHREGRSRSSPRARPARGRWRTATRR